MPRGPRTTIAAALLAVLGSVRPLPASSWVPIGPTQPRVFVLAVDPADARVIYGGGRGVGVFKSRNRGRSWLPARRGLPRGDLLALVIYVAGDAGVFVTTDLGDGWTRLPVADPGTWCEALATDAGDGVYVGTTSGVFASDDGGRSWELRQRGFFGGNVNVLAVAPTHAATLYVAPASGGVLKTTDDGANWVPTSPHLEDAYIYDLVVDSTHPSTLYAGRFSASDDGGGVSKSTDGGATWAFMREGLPRDGYAEAPAPYASVTRLVLEPADPRTLYALLHAADASVYRTEDGAATWTAAGLGGEPGVLDDIETLAIDPTRRGRLYAGARDGFVYRTSDGGDTWTPLGRLSTEAVRALAVDPSHPDSVFAGLYLGGVRRSSGAGLTWSAVGPGLPAETPVNDLAIDAGGAVYADTMEGVFRSDDHGNSWLRFDEGLFPATGQFGWSRFFLDPTVPGRLYRIMEGSGVYRRDQQVRGRIRSVRVVLRRRSWDLVVRGTLGDVAAGTIDPASTGVRIRVLSPTADTLLDAELPGSGWRRLRRSWAYLAEPGDRVARLRIREGPTPRVVLRTTSVGLPPAGDVASLSVAVVFDGALDRRPSGAVAVASDVRCRPRRGARLLGCHPL